MAVHFSTSSASNLLRDFDARIAQKEPKGSIETWVKHSDGVHYTHASNQWSGKAFFKASPSPSELTFFIVRSKSAAVSTTAYGYYHGHLIETFLNHFDNRFDNAEATPMPITGDKVS